MYIQLLICPIRVQALGMSFFPFFQLNISALGYLYSINAIFSLFLPSFQSDEVSVTRLKNLIHELDAFLDELADHSTLENQLELLRQTQVFEACGLFVTFPERRTEGLLRHTSCINW